MTVCTHMAGGHSGASPMYGTAAARARAWLLIEHPGPWPAYYGEMKMPAGLRDAVTEAEARAVRAQLIRRPDQRRMVPPLQVYAGWSAGSDAWIESRELASYHELARLDFDALAAGRSPGLGSRLDGTLLLVCTHGRRSPCCARLGRPLAATLAERFPDEVWETTHVGGDDFAANLVCLPHGLYFGRVTPEAAAEVAGAYRRGEIALDSYRGRAGWPGPLQAVEHFVRAETGCRRIADLSIESSATGALVTEAVVRAAGRRYRVVVEEAAAREGPEEAASPGAESGARYRLLDLTPTADDLA